jgi:hypothetical protein
MKKISKKQADYAIISSTTNNLLTQERFSDLVEKLFLDSKGAVTILEAMSIVVDEYSIDYSKVKKLMTPELKKKIDNFCKNQNLIKRPENKLKNL